MNITSIEKSHGNIKKYVYTTISMCLYNLFFIDTIMSTHNSRTQTYICKLPLL
jgi:hypothetical protein